MEVESEPATSTTTVDNEQNHLEDENENSEQNTTEEKMDQIDSYQGLQEDDSRMEDEMAEDSSEEQEQQKSEDGETTRSSRRSLRKSVTNNNNTSDTKKTPRKGVKRSMSSTPGQAKASKIPRFEYQPVKLSTKTIHLPTGSYIADRNSLLEIKPKLQNIEFGVGDLLWAKMQGYPWWPCMVTNDPFTGEFYKSTPPFVQKRGILYHVQYFGSKPYRGYTLNGAVMPFEGFENFKQKITQELEESTDKSKRLKVEQKYFVKNSIWKNWNESVSEAENALDMDKKSRIRLLTFNYITLENEIKTPKTPKNSSSTNKKSNQSSLLNQSSFSLMNASALSLSGGCF